MFNHYEFIQLTIIVNNVPLCKSHVLELVQLFSGKTIKRNSTNDFRFQNSVFPCIASNHMPIDEPIAGRWCHRLGFFKLIVDANQNNNRIQSKLPLLFNQTIYSCWI